MENIIVIVGPTGVGKTKLSVELAKKLNAEIVNADSCQVYQDFNIGTAKIKEEEKEGIMHHLFDIVDWKTTYTVCDYQRDAREKIKSILARGKKVILVGGTGLYIKACLYDYRFEKEEKTYDFTSYSNEELLENIKKYEPNSLVHVNNRKRLERTLTKYWNGALRSDAGDCPLYSFCMIGLTTNRDNLYRIIDNRVDQMMRDGLLEEVENLFYRGVSGKAIMTAIGYKELYQYFQNKISLDEAIDLIKKNSRRYAKRQYTFFHHQFDNINWVSTDYECFDNTIEQVLDYLKQVRK